MRSRSLVQRAPLKISTVWAALVLMLHCAGCDAPHAEVVLQSSNQMKELILAVRNHKDIHAQWPVDLDEVRNTVEGNFDTLMQNPVTGDSPGYEYVAPAADADPATTVILYQLRDGQRDPTLRVGFADGRVAEFASPE